jgi:hypothetical protein
MEWWEATWQRRARALLHQAARVERLRRDRDALLGRGVEDRPGAPMAARFRRWVALCRARLALRRAERALAQARGREAELRRGIEADAASRAHQHRLPYEDALRDAVRRFGLDR